MKNLLIVESPTKVKSIEKFLGNDYKVLASVGHVRDLMSSSRKGIDVENNYEPVWRVSKDKKDIISEIKNILRKLKRYTLPQTLIERERQYQNIYMTFSIRLNY